MIRTENNKLIIEIETTEPEQTYRNLLNGIALCVQGIAEGGTEEKDQELPDGVVFLMQLYRAMLPSEEQVEMMFKKKK